MTGPRPRAWRLRTRLIALVLALLAIVCLLLGGLTYVVMRSELTQRLDAQLAAASGRVGAFREHGGQGPGQGRWRGRGQAGATPTAPGGTASSEPGESEGGQRRDPVTAPGLPPHTVTMMRRADQVVYPAARKGEDDQPHPLSAADQAVLQAVPGDGKPVTRTLSLGEYRLRAFTAPDGDVVVTGLPLADRDRTLSQQLATMALVSLGALTLAGVLGMLMVRRELKPLETVAGVATGVAAMPLDAGAVTITRRVPVREDQRDTEVGTVGVALNQLLDSVQEALEARHRSETQVRRFVADASHELRTPLAAIRGYAEMLRLREPLTEDGQQNLGRVESQAVRMSRLVEDLLTLARLDEGRSVTFRELDLGEVVLDAVTDARAAGRDHAWELDLPAEPVLVRGDAGQLGQVVANLLSNARKHTGPGTRVVTTVTARAGAAVLTVADDGPGIPPEFLPHVFDRFARADAARAGVARPGAAGPVPDGTTGLGLAIVQGIVAAHGGTITVESQPGRTVFTLRLPAPEPEPK